MGEKYRHFSREFKRDAVQLVTEKRMPVDAEKNSFETSAPTKRLYILFPLFLNQQDHASPPNLHRH